MNPGLITLIGIGVVFSGLILLIVAIKVMNAIMGLFGNKAPEEQPSIPQKVAENEDDSLPHDELIVIIAAAIAAQTNTDAAGLRILSVKRV